MNAIEDQIHFLYLYTTSSQRQNRALIETMSKSQLRALLEVILNVLKGTVPVTVDDKTQLGHYKLIIRRVVDRSESRKRKRDLLIKYYRIFRLIVQIALKQIVDGHGSRVGINSKRRIWIIAVTTDNRCWNWAKRSHITKWRNNSS